MLLHCTPQLMSLVLGTTSTLLKVREATWVQLNIDCLIDFLKCLTCCGAAETFPLHCAGFARSHNLVNPSCQTPSYMLEPASYEDLYLHPHAKCGDRGRSICGSARMMSYFLKEEQKALLRAVFDGKDVFTQNFFHLALLVALSDYIIWFVDIIS